MNADALAHEVEATASVQQKRSAVSAAARGIEDRERALADAEAKIKLCVTSQELATARQRITSASDELLLQQNRHHKLCIEADEHAASVRARLEQEHAAKVAGAMRAFRRREVERFYLAEALAAAQVASKAAHREVDVLEGEASPRPWWSDEKIGESTRRITDFGEKPRTREQIAAWLASELGCNVSDLLGGDE